ncbi:hypothetical protein [Pontibacter sp. G13]|uniref:hypothetical protein n=1 Tax=Pontibacter sp. G13 TaxID=3074898 RepID=UPI00288975CC|nr:hypothetical protein [Pontibacter sp. G13]WNJ19081.1 hypothetical protein RJD25_01205 [Pontibacter sp. G13]
MKNLIYCIIAVALLGISDDPPVTDRVKFDMYEKAIDESGSSPYYVVVNVKNLQTGEVKEVCTEVYCVMGALKRENCPDRAPFNNRLYHKFRYFEFNCPEALKNIGFDRYTPEELSLLEQSLDMDSLVSAVKNGRLDGMTFLPTEEKKQVMYAHLMFNRGIMMRRGCRSGNNCYLEAF